MTNIRTLIEYSGEYLASWFHSKDDWIQTYTGKKFYPLKPSIDDIDILDIAHSLSLQCRFGGHSLYHYSTAQHSWYLSYTVDKEHALWALLHDAAEAYLLDFVRPLKKKFPRYKRYENRILRLIAQKYGLNEQLPQQVKQHDHAILTDERIFVMAPPPEPWSTDTRPLHISITKMQPETARTLFLARFHQLIEERSTQYGAN